MANKDSFAKVPVPVPTKVTSLELILRVSENGAGNSYSGSYMFQLLDANSQVVETREGNLVPQLSGAQASALTAFLDAMLLKAKGAV